MTHWIRAQFTLLACVLMFCMQAEAAQTTPTTWHAVQGDVIEVSLHSNLDKPSLWCFGKKWPIVKADQHWKGWIGVDLKQKTGSHQILWQAGQRKIKQYLMVSKGKFRVSHIEVAKKMAVFDPPTLARIRREVKALKATYNMPVDAHPDISMRDMPVHGIVSTPFGAQRYVNGEPRSPHSGLDIAAPLGTPIKAPLSGKVLLVADMYLNGNTVAIGHGNGLVSVYSHMQSVNVHPGDWIHANSTIGKVGSTGRATGPHLHWGIRFNNARINPDSLLPKSDD